MANSPGAVAATKPAVLQAENTLAMPAVGWQQLRVLSPSLLELTLISTKPSIQAPAAEWNFIGENFKLQLPPTSDFSVTVNGQPVAVAGIGFKRRPLYAPLKHRDLRIGNYLYVQLAGPVAENAAIVVKVPGGRSFAGSADPLRFNPAIHVNQTGYGVNLPKKATLGYYLGSLGELPVAADAGFTVIEADSGREVFRGKLTPRPDHGYNYPVAPYQKVFEADFTGFNTPGDYRVAVQGMGASYPFTLSDGLAATFARTYALGIYHQRCGGALELPFTRFTHDPCHTTPAQVPTADFKTVQNVLEGDTGDFAKSQAPGTPRMNSVDACLYPFVNKGTVTVTQGHHDAGDYSKYTINSADFIHTLVFAVDTFPGVGALDNLGIPESGDGKSDVLQLAKWEADFLARMQDADGGFYFLVYPRDRKYEGDVTPDHGDPQVVYPKTTAVTAAGVAALAQTARSPLFQKQFPAEAAQYLKQAKLGWDFLERAWAKYGRPGAYQKITHYGNGYADTDEIAWAAAEMYLATGDVRYQERLMKEFDPADPKTRQWSWVRLTDSFGNAIRSYAFADRSAPGRTLNAGYLEKCRAEILAAGEDVLDRASNCAYATSFPLESKRFRTAAWYFPIPVAMDLIAAYQLNPKPAFLDAAIGNLNYEGGENPNNVAFLTGLGWHRQREIVHQFAQNDRRVLPPSGIPLGAVQGGFAYLDPYKKELGALTFPFDGDSANPYPFYDRWGDSFNVTTEFVAVQQARGLAWLAFLMAQTPVKQQAWKSATARITGLPASVTLGTRVKTRLEVDGLDLAGACIVWEARDQEPVMGPGFEFAPVHSGIQWVEAEAQWPDGRRAFAAASFAANHADGGSPLVADGATKALLNFDDLPDGAIKDGGRFQVTGSPVVTAENLGWMASPSGKAVKFSGFDDSLKMPLPVRPELTDSLFFSVWLYIEKLPYGKFGGPLCSYAEQNGAKTLMGFNYDVWSKADAPYLVCGGNVMSSEEIRPFIKLNEWQHYELTYQEGTIRFVLDGKEIRRVPVGNVKSLDDQRKGLVQVVRVGNFIGYADDLCLKSQAGGIR